MTEPEGRVTLSADLSGRTAIVTGAARGIGRAIAGAIAEAGATVLLADLDGDELKRAGQELIERGLSVHVRKCDISKKDELGGVIGDWAKRMGRLDVVFANAGISAGPGFEISPSGTIDGAHRENWDRSLQVNLTGAFDTISAAAGHMKEIGRGGSIIVTSSISALSYSPVSAYAYIAAKGALNAIIRQAAAELGPHGIRVNGIAPGFIVTDLAGGALRRDEDLADDLRARIPLRRLGQASDLVGLAVLLASLAGSYISGAVIPVDGGVVARGA